MNIPSLGIPPRATETVINILCYREGSGAIPITFGLGMAVWAPSRTMILFYKSIKGYRLPRGMVELKKKKQCSASWDESPQSERAPYGGRGSRRSLPSPHSRCMPTRRRHSSLAFSTGTGTDIDTYISITDIPTRKYRCSLM